MIESLKNKFSCLVILIFCITMPFSESLAQNKKKVAKAKIIEISTMVVNQANEPVIDAFVSVGEGQAIYYTDVLGRVSFKAKKDAFVLIEAQGYESYLWNLTKAPDLKKIILSETLLFSGERDDVQLPMLVSEKQRYVVGAITQIKGKNLDKYTDALLSNSLQGQGMGLVAIMNNGGLANNPASLYLRGQSSYSANQLLTIVDGIERPIDYISAEEIESISLLKDATAKILYGSRAANGILMITTKRGVAQTRVRNVKFEYGLGSPTYLPGFLDAHDYAQLYNEARENDGLPAIYNNLDGYRNSSGANDILYPNVDYYDYFLKNNTNYSKFTSEFSGGNQDVIYALNLGYLGYGGLQKEGIKPRQDRFNMRANLDINLTESISAFAGVVAVIDSWKRSTISHNNTFVALSSHRPNEYPIIIDDQYIPATKKGVPALGASSDFPQNLLGALKYSGDLEEQFISSQMNFGMDFDLDDLTSGLSAKAYVTFDNYFENVQQRDGNPATYKPIEGIDTITFVKLQKENIDKDYNVGNNHISRNLGFTGQLNYNKTFDEHVLSSTLGFFYYQNEQQGYDQNVVNNNLYLRANYTYFNKYVLEVNMAQMGSNRFEKGNRHYLSSAFGAAWIFSEEKFLTDISVIDFMKLKASWGMLGYDANTLPLLYESRWYDNGGSKFGEANSNEQGRITLRSVGNSNLEWETSREINIGFEGLMLNHKLGFEINYFNELRDNIIEQVSSEYSAVHGDYVPYANWGKVANQGVEAQVNWHDKQGDFSYTVGGNVLFSKNEVLEFDEVDYPDEDRRKIGKPSDVILGYENLGLFGKDIPLSGATHQTFGYYGTGDLAYKNQNADAVIDDLDRVPIGNSFPRTTLGINVSLQYKNWGFYALGTAALGVYANLNNTYYSNYGMGKYSDLAWDSYHPTRNPNGMQPRLTSTEAENNMKGSDFWTQKSDYFRLKNVEISYTISNTEPASVLKNIKFYLRGNNLFVLTKVKGSDPEVPDAGVTNYPVLRMFSGGVSMAF